MFKLFQKLREAAQEGAEGGEGGDDGAGRQEIVAKAKGLGWVPKAEWKGPANAWTDAEEYVQRGEQILPILRANNRKSEQQIVNLQTELQKAQKLIKAQNESLTVLTQMNTKANRDTAKEKRRELLRAQAQARKDDNTDLEIQIGEQIEEATATIAAAEAELETPVVSKPGKAATDDDAGANPMIDPDFIAWQAENQWFGPDEVKTAAASAAGRVLRKAGDTSKGRAFLDKVTVEVNKIFEPHRRSGPSKVEGGGNGRGSGDGGDGGGSGGHTFNDLPRDAKEVCERQTTAMVGEGRAFKTKADWKKYYVEQYKWD